MMLKRLQTLTPKGEYVECKIDSLKIDFTKVKKEKDEEQQQDADIRQTAEGVSI